jgi:membrane-associated phospholipid phosphatase
MFRVIPEHCGDCTWFFEKMGACPHPDVSIFLSYISLIPYLIIFYLVAITLIKRKLSMIRLSSMIVCAYIIGDKLLKNIFQSTYELKLGHRPPFSCKSTYGMPSSHVTVIVAVTLYILGQKGSNVLVKLGMVGLCILQGIARIELHYHTYEQVFGGAIFGTVFAFLFFKIFDLLWIRIKMIVPKWIGIQDDSCDDSCPTITNYEQK